MIIYLNVMITILVLLNLLPLVLNLLGPKPTKPLSFENDILFLNALIASAIKDYETYIIKPSKAAGKNIMGDDELKEYQESLILNIYSQMSSNYLQNLYKYFSQEGLRFYISNTINNELTGITLKYNLQFLNIIRDDNKEDITNVSRTDI